MSRSARLLALLQALRCRRRPVTAAALARELQVSERTIYRDLSELAAQGAPVQGEAGVGYMLRPGLFLPPLMLTEDETEAILLGLRYVDQRGDDVLTKAAANAHAKILAVLPQEGQIAATLPMTIPGPKGGGFPDNNKVPLKAECRPSSNGCRTPESPAQQRPGRFFDHCGSASRRFYDSGWLDHNEDGPSRRMGARRPAGSAWLLHPSR